MILALLDLLESFLKVVTLFWFLLAPKSLFQLFIDFKQGVLQILDLLLKILKVIIFNSNVALWVGKIYFIFGFFLYYCIELRVIALSVIISETLVFSGVLTFLNWRMPVTWFTRKLHVLVSLSNALSDK